MTETWTQWLRAKFDTVLLLALFGFLIHSGASEYHEVLGALLLALTGARNALRSADPPPGTVSQITDTRTVQRTEPTPPTAPPAPPAQKE